MYNDVVMDHFQHPRNVGEMNDASSMAEVGSQECGDTMKVFIKVKDEVIEDIKFQTYGCAAAIASSSIATEMVKGLTVDEAKKLTKNDVVEKLGGLPDPKIHCSLLAVDGILGAIEAFEKKD
ncbi:MAG: iron-sulfur cluster assembly scaffold protein [Eubacteriales bacterium]